MVIYPMATYSIGTEPPKGGALEISIRGEKQTPQDKHNFTCSAFEEVSIKAIPSEGFEFVEFQIPTGPTKENPLKLNTPFGGTVTAYFQETKEAKDWKEFLQLEETREKDEKMKALRLKFEAQKKQKAEVKP